MEDPNNKYFPFPSVQRQVLISSTKWLVSIFDNETYVIENVQFGTYISPTTTTSSTLTFTFGSPSPASWLIQEYKSGYIVGVGTSDQPHDVFNLDGSTGNIYANDTPLLAFPFYVDLGPSNQVWYFNSTTPDSASQNSTDQNSPDPDSTAAPHSASSSYRGPPPSPTIAGGVIGGVLGLLLIVLAFWFGMRRGKAAMLRRDQHVREREAPSSTVSQPVEVTSSNPTLPHQSTIRTVAPTVTSLVSSNAISPQPLSIFQLPYGLPRTPAPAYAYPDGE
jgi:hypothetical protein